MRKTSLSLILAGLLGSGWNLAAQSACFVHQLRGTYLGHTVGYTDAQMLDPTAESKLLPMACVSQVKLDSGGTGVWSMICNVNENVFPAVVKITGINLNPDCTGELLSATGLPLPGAKAPGFARFIMAPGGNDIRVVASGKGVWSVKLEQVSTQ